MLTKAEAKERSDKERIADDIELKLRREKTSYSRQLRQLSVDSVDIVLGFLETTLIEAGIEQISQQSAISIQAFIRGS